jgi:hypothetical protein
MYCFTLQLPVRIRSLRQLLTAEKHRISTRFRQDGKGFLGGIRFFIDPDCPTLVVNSKQNNNKSQRPRCGGSTAAFCLAFSSLFLIIEMRLIEIRRE